MTSRHLILGGSGFIGRHVARSLVRRGHVVQIVDAIGSEFVDGHVKFIQTDLSKISIDAIISIIAEYDVIHHYAWSTIPSSANENPAADLLKNVGTTLNLLEAVRQFGGKRIIFASSGGTVYGKLQSVPATEQHELNPITAYGMSKVTCENYLQYYHRHHGVDIRIARISNPYGGGQNPARQQGVISTFVYNALVGKELEVFGDGSIVRDFIYIQDLVCAILKLATVDLTDPDLPRIFNIGGGEWRSVNDIIAFVQDAVDAPVAVRRKQGRNFDVPLSMLDLTRAAKYLGWRPSISIDQGIRLMVEDLKADIARLYSSFSD